nr:MAG TPA: hypothetical protein [Caudoviricetes sp.]
MTYFCSLSRFAVYFISKYGTVVCDNAEYDCQ